MHRQEPLQLDAHRECSSANGLRLHTVDGSRTHRQHMNRWRLWRGFEVLRGGMLGCGTNAAQRAYLQRRCALPPMFDAWTAGTAAQKQTEERVSPQRLTGRTSDQKSGVQGTWRHSPFLVRHRDSKRHGVSEFLRGAFAAFFAIA